MRGARIGFQAAANFETVKIGETHIQSDEIGRLIGELQGLCAVACLNDSISASLQSPR
jgi:hypothetical protein